MLATQNVLNDDVQQDLLQRTQRWLDILEARTLALLAATDPETLTPAERETSINRYLQLTARFLQLRQKASQTSNPKPDYNPWLDQILGDPPPNDSPPFDLNSQPLSEEEEASDAGEAPGSLEPRPETSGQESIDGNSPPSDLNTQTAFLPADPEAASSPLPGAEELETEISCAKASASASQPGAMASQVLDRWPSVIIRPQPEVDWLSSVF